MLLSSIINLQASDLTYPPGWEELHDDSGWELDSNIGSVKMYRKPISVFPMPAFKAVLGTIVNPDNLIQTGISSIGKAFSLAVL